MATKKASGKLFKLTLSTDNVTFLEFACATSNGFQTTIGTDDVVCKEGTGDISISNPVPVSESTTITGTNVIQIDDATREVSVKEVYAMKGQTVYWTYGSGVTGDEERYGTGVLSDLSETADATASATFDLTLLATGEWNWRTIS